MNHDISSPAPVTAEAALAVAIRKRRKGPRGIMPPHVTVRLSADGRTVFVPLQGSSGLGMTARVDAEVWKRDILPNYGSVWGANWYGKRAGFQVCRAHSVVAEAAHQRGRCPKAGLARLITGVARGMCVWYRDRDRLNLRLDNLELITRAEHMARIRLARADD